MRRRRLVLGAALLAVAGGLLGAGCGYQGTKSAAPETVEGSIAQPTTTTTTTELPPGDAEAGKEVFTSGGCSGCHTLKDAGAAGTVGPNLDQVKPTLAIVIDRVTNGKGAMPPFKSLGEEKIADVAAYVVKATGGS